MGEIGENFDENAVQRISKLVVIAFISMTSKQILISIYTIKNNTKLFLNNNSEHLQLLILIIINIKVDFMW